MSLPLEDQFYYYLDHQAELAKQYEGKVLVIKNKEVIGVYDTNGEALRKTMKKHKVGTFLIQKCSADPESVICKAYAIRFSK